MLRKIVFSALLACFNFLSGFSQVLLQSDENHLCPEEIWTHLAPPVGLRDWVQEDDSVRGWLHWDTAENFAFGKDRGNLTMIADLNALHPVFRDRVIELIRTCREKGIELAVVETYRTHAKQSEYKKMGRRYTRTGPGSSKHQYGLAVDVVPIVKGEPVWNSYSLWKKIGTAGEKLGFRWGGRWRYLYDPGHFEYAGYTDLRQLAAGNFPHFPRQNEYPCLEEDVRLLKLRWSSLEDHQAAIYQQRKQGLVRKDGWSASTGGN